MAPDMILTVVNADGSIAPSANASRHKIELPANAIKASNDKYKVLFFMAFYFVSVKQV